MSGPTYAEVFAGAGGFSLGFHRAGWHCLWHAEIDGVSKVLTTHWPDVPLYGDVTTLDGAELRERHGTPDILIGGSPCQDLSVAGKRKGLGGARSSLFHEQMRLWAELGADLCLWENVDGARSSNGGQDFGVVLGAFVGALVPVPSDGWRGAGVVAGPRGVAAWRVLDAQYFGVPQRRRRIFVLGTRTGSCDPAQVLSLTEGVRGDTPPRREAGERAAAVARDGAQGQSGIAWRGGAQQDEIVTADQIVGALAHSSNAHMGHHQPKVVAFHHTQDPISAGVSPALGTGADGMGVISFQEVGKRTGASTDDPRAGIGISEVGDPMHTLQAGAQHGVLAFDAKQDGADASPVAPTIMAAQHDGSHANGGGWVGVLAFDLAQITSKENRSRVDAGGPAPSLNGAGQVHVCGPLEARTVAGGFPGTDGAVGGHVVSVPDVARCDTAGEGARQDWETCTQLSQVGIPRRLTPKEAERLMSWPDDWTKCLGSDSRRYRACGNGVVSNVAQWIAERLALALRVSEEAAA